MSPAPTGAHDLDRLARALGRTPPVTLAAAHVYPAAAPDFAPAPRAARESLRGDRLRLYVHVPFCNYKCNFCHYATRVGDDRALQERYIAALERELVAVPRGTPLIQLFMGGGTPTALAPELLDRLLAAVFARVSREGEEVHTVETSPESLSDAHVAVLRRHGIRRVSMGVQSLDDRVLAAVHRRHDETQVLASIDRAVEAGLIQNVDLMYGLPGQSQESFRRDLATVAGRGVHGLTLYDLRISEGHALHRRLDAAERLELGRLLEWRKNVLDAAREHGFQQTRWHTFKRLDGRAREHQRAACNDDDGFGYQLGIGLSARSHVGYTVTRNHDRMHPYLARIEAGESPVESVFPLDAEARRTQYVARSIGDGGILDRGAYAAAFGRPVERDYGDVLDRHRDGGLLESRDHAYALTETGELLYDRVLLGYYPKRAIDWLWAHA